MAQRVWPRMPVDCCSSAHAVGVLYIDCAHGYPLCLVGWLVSYSRSPIRLDFRVIDWDRDDSVSTSNACVVFVKSNPCSDGYIWP